MDCRLNKKPSKRLATVRTLVLLLALFVFPAIPSWAAEGPDPVADCPQGLVCFLPSEYRLIARKLAELDRLKATRPSWIRRHVGFGVSIGPPIAYCSEIGEASACVAVTPGIVIKF